MSGCGEVVGNGAPSLFHDIEDSLLNSCEYSVAVEKCPVCRSGEHTFYCAKCVIRDNIAVKVQQLGPILNVNKSSSSSSSNHLSQSKSIPSSEPHDVQQSTGLNSATQQQPLLHKYSLLEGCRRWRELRIQDHELSSKIDAKMVAQYALDDKKLKMEKLRERVQFLKCKLEQKTSERDNKRSQCKATSRENKKKARYVAGSRRKYPAKVEEMNKRKEEMEVREQAIRERNVDCNRRRLKIVRDVERFMFPVEPVGALSKSNDSLDLVTKEIQDASSHHYVKGEWSYVDTTNNFQYTIAGARFFASGECVELRQYIDYSPEQKIACMPSCAHGEWAALSHISQFVQCMAATLDVHIPYMTYIPLLNLDTASCEDLTNFLAQVNMNLASLSASQGVDMSSYTPRRTISNLFHLLKREDLGRSQPCSLVITSQLQAVHDEIRSPLLYEPLPGEQPEDVNYVIVTESPIIRSTDQITASYAGAASSIVTSAVSAVSSIWNWR